MVTEFCHWPEAVGPGVTVIVVPRPLPGVTVVLLGTDAFAHPPVFRCDFNYENAIQCNAIDTINIDSAFVSINIGRARVLQKR